MTTALVILAIQTLLGALDNILHHELTERLASKPSARRELALHSAREAIYGVLFLTFAWTEPRGLFAAAVIVLLAIEVAITVADFIEEDRTRLLPPFERALHTLLAVGYGVFLAFALPWLIANGAAPTDLIVTSYGFLSWYFTLAAIGVFAFALRNAVAVRSLARHRAPAEKPPAPSGRTVLVTGATGFIGQALVARLIARGDRVFALARDKRQSLALLGTCVRHIDVIDALPRETRIDAVVNLAGAPILGLPWTRARRAQIWRSRVDLTIALIEGMSRLQLRPDVLVNASAVGFYGDGGDAALREGGGAGQGFAAELCSAWECAAERAASIGMRVVRLRIGIVFDKSGGALPMMAVPARFGLGAVFGDGRQWMSWITRDDLVRMIMTAIDDGSWEGAFNAVAPEPLRHGDFQRALARTFHRPLFLRAPAWLLRASMGEMGSIFLNSQRVIPARATERGFVFDVSWAADALHLQFGPPPAALPQREIAPIDEAELPPLAAEARDMPEVKRPRTAA